MSGEKTDEQLSITKLPKTFKLRKPINDGEKEIHELKITTPPNTGVFMNMSFANPKMSDFMDAMSKIFRIPVPILKTMDPSDAMDIAEFISGFLARD